MTAYEYQGEELEVFALAANWKGYVARLLHPYIAGAVLEVGAGLGETTRALWNPSVERWVCVEPDPRLAGRLAEKLADGDLTPEVIVGDIDQVPESEHFDCIVYIDVLEHIRNDSAELQRAATHLAPGGRLIVLSPAYQVLYSDFDRALGHERRYTRHSLERAFPRELERIALFYADSVGMLLSLANRLLLRQTLPTAAQIRFWDRVVIPTSRVVDWIIRYAFGRSIIGVYRLSKRRSAA